MSTVDPARPDGRADDAPRPGEVTRLLQEVGERPEAAETLLALVYDQFRRVARRRMAGERSNHALDATALVHEVCIRLLGESAAEAPDGDAEGADDARGLSWTSRGHFYGAAAEAMRRLLIDHARRRGSLKRGGGRRALPESVLDLAAADDPESILGLDEAVTILEGEDARAAAVVGLRFFAGLSVEETARSLDCSVRTVIREWTFARARLHQIMTSE